jgi:hypothetical protein
VNELGGAPQDGQPTPQATIVSPFGPLGHGVGATGHDRNWQLGEPGGHWSRHSAPDAQLSMLQGSWVQANVQLLDGLHCTAQFPTVHMNSQVLPIPQVHC